MPRPGFPSTLWQFQTEFPVKSLARNIWQLAGGPMVSVAPGVGTAVLTHWANKDAGSVRRAGIRSPLTAETILHNSRIPLMMWFWTAYLMTTDKRGISALLLQRQLGLKRYETAWMMLHKFRRAMINAAESRCVGRWR